MDDFINNTPNETKAAHCRERLSKPKRKLTIKRNDGRIHTLTGKVTQVLDVLISNYNSGATLLDFSKATTAFRAANHICDLRRLGIYIETTREAAGDTYIGRYFLREPLTIIDGAAQ